MTNWFEVICGLKQVCLLSSMLFNIYINDLVYKLKKAGVCIPINNDAMCVMLYPDDIVMLTEIETRLQLLVIILHGCSTEWQKLDIVDKYKHTGLILTEHLYLKVNMVVHAANRALDPFIFSNQWSMAEYPLGVLLYCTKLQSCQLLHLGMQFGVLIIITTSILLTTVQVDTF